MNKTFPTAKNLLWEGHDMHMTISFCEFFQKKSLIDVSIVCADKIIPAHKLVLAAASPFFHRIIDQNPCKHPTIILNDYPSWVIEMILGYIYCGETRVPEQAVHVFIEVAKALEIKGLEFLMECRVPQISPSQQPRRKQPKPIKLLEPEDPLTPLDFSVKAVTSTSNGTFTINQTHVEKVQDNDSEKKNNAIGLDTKNIEEHLTPVVIEKQTVTPDKSATKTQKQKEFSDQELLTLPYPHLQPFNSKVHLKGFTPKIQPPKKLRRSQSLSSSSVTSPLLVHTPTNNEFSLLNIHRQHQSARGGPPRSWTNQDLMNALDDVWSKRMNTSQAARYHRIPYNSLLMYVRGKYGKTLNIKMHNDQQNITSSTSSPTVSPQMNTTSFPKQGSLPPHDLLQSFALLSKVAAQNNIK